MENGMPTLAPFVHVAHKGWPLTVKAGDWPRGGPKAIPAISSKQVQILTYGPETFQVSLLYSFLPHFPYFKLYLLTCLASTGIQGNIHH